MAFGKQSGDKKLLILVLILAFAGVCIFLWQKSAADHAAVGSGVLDKADRQKERSLLFHVGRVPQELYVSWKWEEADQDMAFLYALCEEGGEEELPEQQWMTALPALWEGEGGSSYRLLLTDLLPGRSYRYCLADDRGRSRIGVFRTFGEAEFSFLFFGDPQIRLSSLAKDQDRWREVLEIGGEAFEETAFFMTAGDQVDDGAEESLFQAFLWPEGVRRWPLAAVYGNHDSSGSLFNTYFFQPDGGSGRDYYFACGGSLFVVLDSNCLDMDEHQKTFAEARAWFLQTMGKEEDWLITAMHHSIYSAGPHSMTAETKKRRAAFSELLTAVDADLVLMGHDHSYARSFLMEADIPVLQEAPYFEGVKKEGQVLYITASSSTGSKFYQTAESPPAYAAAYSMEAVPQVTNIWVQRDQIQIRTYRAFDMSLLDQFTLKKSSLH